MKSCARSIEIPAPVDEVWSVLASFDDLARWAPEVDHSCLLHPSPGRRRIGVGAVRRVQVGRNTVLETIRELSAPHKLAYDITGLPAVLRHVRNEWCLEAGPHGTKVSITSSVDAGHRPPQQIVAGLVARRLGRTSDAMLVGLARHLEIAAVRQDSADGMPQFPVGVGS